MMWGPGFWTNWNDIALSWGEVEEKFHGPDVPEHAWTIGFRFWPFRLIVFKQNDRVIWLGDKQWKRDCGIL